MGVMGGLISDKSCRTDLGSISKYIKESLLQGAFNIYIATTFQKAIYLIKYKSSLSMHPNCYYFYTLLFAVFLVFFDLKLRY
jgi:hypothetical protein